MGTGSSACCRGECDNAALVIYSQDENQHMPKQLYRKKRDASPIRFVTKSDSVNNSLPKSVMVVSMNNKVNSEMSFNEEQNNGKIAVVDEGDD